mmetsp:Transcript_122199/g.279872  ORF Transcript_122199/g.279872 Transcript_122199/m.279872 type:complete len:87 (-) Transcript_122199:150-410(-)
MLGDLPKLAGGHRPPGELERIPLVQWFLMTSNKRQRRTNNKKTARLEGKMRFALIRRETADSPTGSPRASGSLRGDAQRPTVSSGP